MFKRIFLTGTFFSIATFAYSQTVSVPKGIKYKPTSTIHNDKAKLLLKDAINNNNLSDSLFDDLCYIGPILWVRYKEIDNLNAIKGGNIQFNVPVYDKTSKKKTTQQMAGKLIQTNTDFQKVWSQVSLDLKDSVTFRKLTPTELTYYWAVIFFDIEEPIFIADNGVHKLLMQLSPRTNKILWIDEVFD